MKYLIAAQFMLLLLIAWFAVSAMRWQGPENYAMVAMLFVGAPAAIVQCICGIIVWNRTSDKVEDNDGLPRGVAAAIPMIGLLLVFGTLY